MLDNVSEERLAQVHPELSRRIHQLAGMLSFNLRVVQGARSYAEQDALYAQGRTEPGKVVTEAKGGYSMHNFALAVDVCPMLSSGPDWNAGDPQWKELLEKAPLCHLSEGAEWHNAQGKATPDNPHLYPEESPASPSQEMRDAFAVGGLEVVWAIVFPQDNHDTVQDASAGE